MGRFGAAKNSTERRNRDDRHHCGTYRSRPCILHHSANKAAGSNGLDTKSSAVQPVNESGRDEAIAAEQVPAIGAPRTRDAANEAGGNGRTRAREAPKRQAEALDPVNDRSATVSERPFTSANARASDDQAE